jgi:hypothetical protein
MEAKDNLVDSLPCPAKLPERGKDMFTPPRLPTVPPYRNTICPGKMYKKEGGRYCSLPSILISKNNFWGYQYTLGILLHPGSILKIKFSETNGK